MLKRSSETPHLVFMIVFGGIFGRILSDPKRLAQDEIRAQRLAQFGPSYVGFRASRSFGRKSVLRWMAELSRANRLAPGSKLTRNFFLGSSPTELAGGRIDQKAG